MRVKLKTCWGYNMIRDETQILLDRIINCIGKEDIIELQSIIEDIHFADLVEVVHELEDNQIILLFKALELDVASEILSEVSPESFYNIISLLNIKLKLDIFDSMSYGDIVHQLNELDENKKNEILSCFNEDDAKEIRELLIYKEDTAGGLMTTEFISLNEDFTVKEAIEYLRKFAPTAETIYYLFVIDDYEKLSGVISLREIIIGSPEEKIKYLMNSKVISVNINDDQEEVAKIVSKYNFLAIPVIDEYQQMKGIITVDDILDIMEEEATEDILKIAGTSEAEIDNYEEKSGARIFQSLKSRLPWLIITLFGGMISASIISKYQDALTLNAIVAIFIPILAGMGGNVGTQSSTITVRSIAIRDISGIEVFKTILHEMIVGFLVGLICSMIALVSSYYLYKVSTTLAMVVGLAMWANMFLSGTIGTLVPLIFKKIGIDPAVASAPFITMTVDVTGLSIYFTLVTTMLKNVAL